MGIYSIEPTKKPKVFLGGTCNESKWREKLIDLLTIDYFNPVVEDWTPECQAEEIKQREECDFVLYVITPEMKGCYSIAEVVDDSNKRPNKTIFCITEYLRDEDPSACFEDFQMKSLRQVKKMVMNNGVISCDSLQAVADYLNRSNPRRLK